MIVTPDDVFKVDNVPVREKAYHVLKEAIIKNKLNTNNELREQELADLMGISRTPVREAMRKLEADGLIYRNKSNRPFITKLSYENASNIYKVRSKLEGLAAGQAAENISNSDIEELESFMEKASEYINKGDIDKFDEVGRLFHETILYYSTNEVCSNIINKLADHINRYRWISMTKDEKRPGQALKEHFEIVQHMKNRDMKSADEAMVKHILNAGDLILESLSEIF